MSGRRVTFSVPRRSSRSARCYCSRLTCTLASVMRSRTGGEMKKLAGSVLFFALLLPADFEPSQWRFRRPLAVDKNATVSALALDRSVQIASRLDLADLRVVCGGEEVPYVIERMSGSYRRDQVPMRMMNQGV